MLSAEESMQLFGVGVKSPSKQSILAESEDKMCQNCKLKDSHATQGKEKTEVSLLEPTIHQRDLRLQSPPLVSAILLVLMFHSPVKTSCLLEKERI
jgi:hypothetical protein